MSFTYPIFLWGLTALAIPIIIHLFNFRKAKRVSFSNVRFLENIKKQNSSNLRLRHLLILLTRLLFIFFLVLVFAQPYIPSIEDGLQSRSVTLYIDNSNSMSNLTERGVSGFNETLGIAQEITNLYPAETQFSLITNDFVPGTSQGRAKAKTAEDLTEIKYSSLSRSGQELFDKIQGGKPGEIKDIFILSDFQQSTIGQFEQIIDSTNQYHLIRMEMTEQKNIFVDTVLLENPFLVSNQKNAVHIKVRNDGTDINDLQVKFFVNDNQSGTTSIDIEANSTKDLVFELSGRLESSNRCRVSFEDFPVVFDNDYFFTLNLASKIKIVEVTDEKKTPIGQVYKNNPLFSITSFQSNNISYPILEQADLLILNGLPNIAAGLEAQVNKQLSQGKSVIFIPASVLSTDYRISNVKMQSDSLAARTSLKLPDLNNPFFANIFEELGRDTQMPEVSTTYRFQPNGRSLLKTKTDVPYLSLFPTSGNLYLFAAPLSAAYTNFHRHALFVPVLHRIAELSSSNHPALAYSVDQMNLSLKVDSIPNGQLYKLIREDAELIPSQRISANELVLDMPRYLLSAGYYDLMLGYHQITTVAFNHPKLESDLKTLSMEEIKARLTGVKNLNLYEAQEAKVFSNNLKEKYHQRDLWKYALILSLIFLFAESLLLRFL
ncbi:MAG: BatA domain-containing protein [Reichenbachiella sp.]|uniref:BatA domain-containing protein n=1 Tax=Reichenbachiella sp. TaxID=2184521 RepID=UPI003267D53D